MSIVFLALMLLVLSSFADGARLFKRQAIVPDTSSPTTPAPLPPEPTTAPARNSLFGDFPGFGTGGGGGAGFPSFNFDFDPFSSNSGRTPNTNFPTFNNRNTNGNFPSFNNANNFPSSPPLSGGTTNPNSSSSNVPAYPNLPSFGNRNPTFPTYNNNFGGDSDFGFDNSPFSSNSFPSFSNSLPGGGGPGNPPSFSQFGSFPANQNAGLFNFPTPRPRPTLPSRLPGPPLQFPTRPSPVTAPNPAASVCYPPVDLPYGFDRVSNDTIPDRILQQINTSLTNDPQISAVLDVLAGADDPTPNLYPLPESSDQSCPAVAYIATKFTRFGSDCWILNGKQQPIFYVKCLCQQCLQDTGFAQSPQSFCQPFTVAITLMAYCESKTSITAERVSVPVTCRCRYNTAAVTQSPALPPDTTTPAPVTAVSSPTSPGAASSGPPPPVQATN